MNVKPYFYSNTDKYKKYKALPHHLKAKFEAEIKAMLHAHRDCLRNRSHSKDNYNKYNGYSNQVPFDPADGYYGEAFGMLRALSVLGYGYFGSVNTPYKSLDKSQHTWDQDSNLCYWFNRLKEEVLEEENWKRYGDGSGRCEYCLKKYRKDDKSVQDGIWWTPQYINEEE